MASSLHFLPLFSLFFLITFSVSHRPIFQQYATVIRVTKDPSTLQYLTQINQGTPNLPIKLVVDLGGQFLWVSCDSSHVSSSHRPIRSTSLQCSMAKPNSCSYFSTTKTCDLATVNSISRLISIGELAEDILTVHYIDGSDLIGMSLTSITAVENFLFVCAPPLLLNGLASGAKGMLGLGRTRMSLPSQIIAKSNIGHKFYVCLSSSNGIILSGDVPNFSIFGPKIQSSLTYTPLISNQVGTSGDYSINLRSIKVCDYRISINPKLLSGGIKLSTVVPYTTMERSIYETLIRAYISDAAAMNLTRVAAEPPFGVCFSSKGVGITAVGPTVPSIDFVLQSDMVKWRINGRNSMVRVSDSVMCLGVLDGGLAPSDSIVIGGYQLEDHLLEFDLGTSMLGFSSSLLSREISCSDVKLYPKDSESV